MTEEGDLSREHLFMRAALAQAKLAGQNGEVPVGAVIVHEGRVIAKAYNQVETLRDPTAHAEIIAITQAANALSSKWLHGCSIYVTLEPCSMCAGALVLARVQKLYFGAPDPKTGACGSVSDIVRDARLNHQVEVSQGILAEECASLISGFFQRRRAEQKSI